MEIRPASAEDMLYLERVLGPERTAFYRHRLKRQGVILTSWEGEEPTGAVYVTWEPADEDLVRLHLPGVPFVHRLHVVPGLRNRGRGKALVREAEELDEVRMAGRLAAGVDLDEDQVAGWWTRLGYREWEHGIAETVREEYAPDGTVGTVPDLCRIFVKDLDSS
ncbi:GNAT family N-acetyltransferase [Asanoa sp. NPDC049518]|uniref:GNAT family N-acetyltransferase n=1 Tax=unclassified Asanoa TaxID=2685164 RepID=UPI0034303C89